MRRPRAVRASSEVATMAALLAGCSSPPPPALVHLPPPLPAASAPATPPPPVTAPRNAANAAPPHPYVGVHVGLHLPELPRFAKLPPELTFVAALELGARPDAVQIITARKGDDLLMLLTNLGGVVIDALDVPGVARGFEIVPACRAASGAFADAALRPAPCASDLKVDRAWNVHEGKIVPFAEPVTCTCIIP